MTSSPSAAREYHRLAEANISHQGGSVYGAQILVAGPVAGEPQTKFSSLVVTVTPADAQVHIIGGPPAAESLLKTLRVEPAKMAQRRYHLPVGDYRLRIARDGHVTAEREVSLSAPLHRIAVRLAPR